MRTKPVAKKNSPTQLVTAANGAQTIINGLLKYGHDTVFGYPGGQVIPLYDALYDSKIRHILTRHEQGAIHAADGWARITGRPGIVFATSGPGATNLVTGLANAHMDSVPLVVITGQVATTSIGADSFQEADIYGISIPITKHNYLVKNSVDLPRVLAEAFYLANTGRPGPVLIDVPKDIQVQEIQKSWPETINIPGYNPNPPTNPAEIQALADLLNASQRPILYVGGGAILAKAEKQLRELVEKANIPVVVTLQAKGVLPDDHKLVLGLAGMHGSKVANLAIYNSDLILGFGVRFDDRVVGDTRRFAPVARIVHVDIDPAEIGKRLAPDLPITGNLKTVLEKTLELVKPNNRSIWLEELSQIHSETTEDDYEAPNGISPQKTIKLLSEMAKPDAIVVTDVGQHQMWAAQHYISREPRKFLSSGGLGAMGFGLPAAIGAQIASPSSQVILIVGDGGFQMNIQELATIRSHNLPIKILVVNNGCLGMVRQWQKFFFKSRYSQTIFDWNPNFTALGQVYDIPGQKVDDPNLVEKALKSFLSSKGSSLLDLVVPMEANVMPMIPAGQGQTDFFDESRIPGA
ncbi:MAG: biosynthetic-type acetolactate synthase large subunit [Deltaproteobacteria bacterium]|nr:biosynthetic-type acetolactate synthase large subunit [Deltaproteobacteria bacterium]